MYDSQASRSSRPATQDHPSDGPGYRLSIGYPGLTSIFAMVY